MAQNVCLTPGNPYHMSRHEIIDWINDTLQVKIKALGDLGEGSHYCQLMDMMFPGTINMKKVKWSCRHETEKYGNFKILQEAFKRVAIDKKVPINDMIKGNLKANLEFMQWFVLLFDANYEVHEYDPVKERKRCKTPANLNRPKSRRNQLSLASDGEMKMRNVLLAKSIGSALNTSGTSSLRSSTKSPFQRNVQRSRAEQQIQNDLDTLKKELIHFKNLLQNVEEQRQYELRKLLTIEDYCRNVNSGDLGFHVAQKVLSIAKAVESGFEVPDNEEEWIIATGGKVIIPQKCPENESLLPEEQDRNVENVSIAASSQKENDQSDEISNVSDTW